MRRPGDSVSFENPAGGELQLFPEVGLTRGYGGGEPALIQLTGEGAPSAFGTFELGVGEPPRIGGPPGSTRWTLTHAGGPLPVFWPPGSAVALGGVMGTRRTLALLFVQLLTYLFLLAGASSALGLFLEAPVASLCAGVVWLVSLTSTLPAPLAPLNLTNYVDVMSLTKNLIPPADAPAAALAASTVGAALVAAALLRKRVR
jgi:hypothetical protein